MRETRREVVQHKRATEKEVKYERAVEKY